MLHIVNKSPFERSSLDSCLRVAPEGDAILLIEVGVYAAMTGTSVTDKVEGAKGAYRISVLGPDLDARGIGRDRLIDGIDVVDYAGFVDLVVENGPSQSWL